MNAPEEIFLELLREFLLISENQLENPIRKFLFSDNHENLNNQVEGLISAISRIKEEKNSHLTEEGEELIFNALNDLLINYYNSNDYYFNYKNLNNKLKVIDLRDDKRIFNIGLQFTLINIEGYFLIHNDFKKAKDDIINNYLVNVITNRLKFLNNSFFWNELNTQTFIKIVSLILDEIGNIESTIGQIWNFIPSKFQTSYILSNKDIISSFDDQIKSNKKQLQDWIDLYPGVIFDTKQISSVSDLPICIDTNFYSSEEIEMFFKNLGYEVTTDLNTFNGVVIKGENYKSLLYLKQFYIKKIDCIYIDPPYNTGSKDFLYDDAFTHDQYYWFMENRLSLAYDLLTDDGVIFISIDDNELVSLRQILDRKFIRVGTYVWHKKTQPSFLNKELISVTEYILVYKKNSSPIKMKGGFTDPNKHTELLNISNDLCKRILPKDNTLIYDNGKLYSGTIEKGIYGNNKLQVTLDHSINVINGVPSIDMSLQGKFRWTQIKIDSVKTENRNIVIKSLKTLRPTVSGSGKSKIRPPISLLSKKINNIPTNTDGNFEMKNLFKIPPFYYPKPVNLIKYLIDSVTYNNSEAIILDFFAGSGTTGEAVIELNREDHGKRKFILVEKGEYFDSIIIPRIKKALFSSKWNKGIPLEKNYFESLIKIIKFD